MAATPSAAPRTAASELPAGFVEALDEFFTAVRRSKARTAREAGAGELTQSQHGLLAAIADAVERPVGELAEAADVSPPTATRMLDGLERSGIVQRQHSTVDRRVVTVRLTAKGRRLSQRRACVVDEKRRALYESLSASERPQVERLLRRLADVIEEL